jgi:hypothetical protein
VKYLKGADHLYCGNDDLHPLFIYFSEAATLKAGPVNLANFRFEVSIASTHYDWSQSSLICLSKDLTGII